MSQSRSGTTSYETGSEGNNVGMNIGQRGLNSVTPSSSVKSNSNSGTTSYKSTKSKSGTSSENTKSKSGTSSKRKSGTSYKSTKSRNSPKSINSKEKKPSFVTPAQAYNRMMRRDQLLRKYIKSNGTRLTEEEVQRYRFSNNTFRSFMERTERKRKKSPNKTKTITGNSTNYKALRPRKMTVRNAGNATKRTKKEEEKKPNSPILVNKRIINELTKRIQDYPNANMNIQIKKPFLEKLKTPLTVNQYKNLEKKFTNASINAAKAAAIKVTANKLRRRKIEAEQKLNTRNINSKQRKIFLNRIQASNKNTINAVISNILKLPNVKIQNRDKLTSMKISEIIEFAKNRGINIPSKIKKKAEIINFLLNRLNSNSNSNSNNNVSMANASPLINSNKNNIACSSLFNVYISKISGSSRGAIVERKADIIEKMKNFNIAAKNYNNNANGVSISKQITLNQYFDILLIMWLDGIHDEYVDTYFLDWYNSQREEKVLPEYFSKEIEDKARNLNNSNASNILFGLMNFLKTGNKRLYEIIHTGIKSKEYLTSPVEMGFYGKKEIENLCSTYGGCPTVSKSLVKARNHLQRIFFEKRKGESNSIKNQFINKIKRPSQIQIFQGWEGNVKTFLLDYFQKSEKHKFSNIQRGNRINLPGNDGLLLAIDQEYSTTQERPLTKLLDNDTTTGLITFGQALDPGSTMLPGLMAEDLISILSMKNPEPEPKKSIIKEIKQKDYMPNAKYYLGDFEFNLKDVNGNSLFHVKLTPKPEKPELLFNGNKLEVNQSAGEAKKSKAQTEKISKYFGDALQYIIFTYLSNVKFAKRGSKTRYPILGSGDSMALLGYTVFSEIVNVKPRMLIDFSEKSKPLYYPINLPRHNEAIFNYRNTVQPSSA